jgi:hypothetical protein
MRGMEEVGEKSEAGSIEKAQTSDFSLTSSLGLVRE